jgi:hypothetical protein
MFNLRLDDEDGAEPAYAGRTTGKSVVLAYPAECDERGAFRFPINPCRRGISS